METKDDDKESDNEIAVRATKIYANDEDASSGGMKEMQESCFCIGADNNDDENEQQSDKNESINLLHFAAVSPSSNTSSGFISCGSSSSSKPTTPTNLLNLLTEENCEIGEDCAIIDNNKNSTITNTTTSTIESSNNNDNSNKKNTEIIIRSDNENGGILANSKKRDFDEIERKCDSINVKNKNFFSSIQSSSSSSSSAAKGGVRLRAKHRNFSFSSDCHSNNKYQQQSSTVRYRQSKKHISLDDEIVVYESDSSVLDARRRNTSNHYATFNCIQNQGRTAASISICRHKSEEHHSTTSVITQPSNQIVSILKRKDSSGKDSPLVTFSPNVKDIEPTRSIHRQGGILKKRSSLDESSRRYRSHSPSSESEKGCLVKNSRRRNSCEEIHQHHHGILKQKSCESTGYSSSGTYGSSGVNTPNSTSSTGMQGILKKPSLTPSDHSSDQTTTKHVSISEAVILAAAELCKDMIIIDDSHEPYIKPILKTDEHHQSHEIKPKPILKKNYSSENEEIRSILKSRKSSREESDDMSNF